MTVYYNKQSFYIFKKPIPSNVSLSTFVYIFVYKNILFAIKSVGRISKIAKAKTIYIFNFMRHRLISFQEVAPFYSKWECVSP